MCSKVSRQSISEKALFLIGIFLASATITQPNNFMKYTASAPISQAI
jgi:hypothetical protein